MREKTDLKTLILAARDGHKFKSYRNGLFVFDIGEILKSEDFSPDEVVGDWEVEWVKEPLKWEGEATFHYTECNWIPVIHRGGNFPSMNGKRFKMTLEEIVEG
jgi:hypothetical protein